MSLTAHLKPDLVTKRGIEESPMRLETQIPSWKASLKAFGVVPHCNVIPRYAPSSVALSGRKSKLQLAWSLALCQSVFYSSAFKGLD